MTNILQRTFKGAAGLAVLLAVITVSSSPAWAQVCQVTANDNDVRAEGITEVVGTITLECVIESGAPFTVDATDDVEISIQLNTDITNATSSTGTVSTTGDAATDDLATADYSMGGIAVFATDQGGSTALTAATEFDDFVLSRDGTELTLEVTGAQANLTTAGQGFDLMVAGIRANASAVGHGEDVMATVSVNGVVARRSPTKVSDVITGLEVEVARQNGLQCEVPESGDMATITIKEGFNRALQNMTNLVLTFSDVPDGAMVLVEEEIGGAVDDQGDTDDSNDVTAPALMLVTGGRGSGVTRIRSGANAGKYMVDLSPTGTGAIIYTYTTGRTGTATAGTPADRNSTVDTLPEVNVYFMWEEGAVAAGRAWVNVSYAPVLSLQNGSIPRYAASSDSPEVLRLSDCDTSMLFPFATNTSGFMTGVALTNPSEADGSCVLDFISEGRVMESSSVDIDAMSTVAFGLSSMVTDFLGHISASCDFVGGSAFVYIDNGGGMGGPTAAQGYILMAE